MTIAGWIEVACLVAGAIVLSLAFPLVVALRRALVDVERYSERLAAAAARPWEVHHELPVRGGETYVSTVAAHSEWT